MNEKRQNTNGLITRTITVYEHNIGTVNLKDDGTADVAITGIIVANRKLGARKLKAECESKGIEGNLLSINETKALYAMSIEKFLKNAEIINNVEG